MSRTGVVGMIGAVVSAFGLFLTLRASDLATNWQRTQTGDGWGGQTDPAMQHTYSMLGLVAVCFGLALVGGATWAWMVRGGASAERPSIEM